MIFQYFIPKLPPAAVTPDLIREIGLGDVARDCLGPRVWERRTVRNEVHGKGPDGSNGTLFAMPPINGDAPVIGYYPQRQDWRPVRAKPKPGETEAPILYWLGFDREDRPRPETVRRARLVEGYDLELVDSQTWTCPTIRRIGGRPGVPTVWGVSQCGGFSETVDDEYRDLWELAGEMMEAITGRRDWNKPETFAAAVRCLGLNYRVGPHEVSAIGLITSENYPQIFKAAIDGDALLAYFSSPEGQDQLRSTFNEEPDKKKETTTSAPDGTSSTPGPSVDIPTTGPVGAN